MIVIRTRAAVITVGTDCLVQREHLLENTVLLTWSQERNMLIKNKLTWDHVNLVFWIMVVLSFIFFVNQEVITQVE